jgi:hypothetical protein
MLQILYVQNALRGRENACRKEIVLAEDVLVKFPDDKKIPL